MTQVLDFLWGTIQYENFAFWGLIQRDLWGPLRPGKISGHGLSQYSFQGTIYAKSAMTQVLVILGRFSENRLFGTYQILWMSDLGGLTLVPYGLPAPNGDTKLLIWPIPLIYVKTAMTQVLDFVLETKLYIRLLISLINDEGSTGPPTAWPNSAIVAFGRPYPGVQYIQKLRWRKS